MMATAQFPPPANSEQKQHHVMQMVVPMKVAEGVPPARLNAAFSSQGSGCGNVVAKSSEEVVSDYTSSVAAHPPVI